MYNPIQLTNILPTLRTSISRPPLRCSLLLTALVFALGWLALSPVARAVSPPPDGGYDRFNTAEGTDALFSLTTLGFFNTATGFEALFSNTTGSFNTADGLSALRHNTTGEGNTANGFRALVRNTTGNDNIALGNNAGGNLTTGSNNIDIFDRGVAGEANTIRIGKQGTQRTTFIAGISGATVTGTAVVVDSNGQLGVAPSSQRFKDAIKPMDKASEAILSFQPVTFHYKKDLDPEGIPQFGLVAEDVEKVNPNLVARDEQ